MSGIYWVLEPAAEDRYGVTLQSESLLSDLGSKGIHSETAIRAFDHYFKGQPVRLHLLEGDEATLTEPVAAMPDVLFLSWIPIFSVHSRDIAVSLGNDPAEFLAGQFQSNPVEPFFLHLPLKAWNVLDFERSKFRHSIPLVPPIPFYCEVAYVIDKVSPPPCFRVPAPGHSQVLGELFVTDEFRQAYQAKALRGGNFRRVSSNAL